MVQKKRLAAMSIPDSCLYADIEGAFRNENGRKNQKQ